MSELLKNIIRYVVFLLVQVFVLNNIPPLHQFVVPYLYFLFILWLPFHLNRFSLLLIGFLFGLSMDAFTKTPGLHAAACVLIAYIRPFIINLLTSRDTAEFNYVSPSAKSMGWAPYATYALVLTLMHHTWMVLLEWMQFGTFLYFIGKVAATTGISFLMIMLVEMLFPRKQRFRTNTA
ncbi:MAG: rod shape-determining protein MreD [Chitinophagaceae bacterium]